jgi:SOS-response transcriptional repressor LexA
MEIYPNKKKWVEIEVKPGYVQTMDKKTGPLATKLAFFLQRSGLRPAALSVRSGVKEGVLSYLLNDKRSADETTLLAIAKALNLSQEETHELFLAAAIRRTTGEAADTWSSISGKMEPNAAPVSDDDVVWLSVIKRVPAGKAIQAVEEYEDDPIPIPRRDLKGRRPDEVLVIRVAGDSMSPTVQNGDAVVVIPDLAYANGDVVVMRIDQEGSVTLKRFYQQGNTVILKADNPVYDPMTFSLLDPDNEVRIIGKVVSLQRKL